MEVFFALLVLLVGTVIVLACGSSSKPTQPATIVRTVYVEPPRPTATVWVDGEASDTHLVIRTAHGAECQIRQRKVKFTARVGNGAGCEHDLREALPLEVTPERSINEAARRRAIAAYQQNALPEREPLLLAQA